MGTQNTLYTYTVSVQLFLDGKIKIKIHLIVIFINRRPIFVTSNGDILSLISQVACGIECVPT